MCVRAFNADGSEQLPLLMSDNYVSLLPGEGVELTLTTAAGASPPARIEASGWRVRPASVAL